MPGGKGIIEQLRGGIKTEEEVAVEALFPARSKFQMLQMITEITPRAEMPWSVLGVFRRLYDSKILGMLQEEHNLNRISQDRKGRLELSEVVAARRIKSEEEKE